MLVAIVSCPAYIKVFTSSRMSSSERRVPFCDIFNIKSSRACLFFVGSLELPSHLRFHSAFLSFITYRLNVLDFFRALQIRKWAVKCGEILWVSFFRLFSDLECVLKKSLNTIKESQRYEMTFSLYTLINDN